MAPAGTAATLELDSELGDRWHVVLYLGSVLARGEWVTLAIGVDLSGAKHVLGLWEGATLNEAVARRAVGELTARGLRTEPGVLVVTDGRRALDEAIKQAWGGRARIAHCQYQVQQEVLAHLPEKERPSVADRLRRIWTAPVDEAAGQLDQLLAALQARHPGAAARLLGSYEAVLTVGHLGLPPDLAPHLAAAGALRVTVEHALEASSPTQRGMAAVRAGLPAAVSRMRRTVGAAGLAILAQRLGAAADVAAIHKTGTVPSRAESTARSPRE
ncbi:transposase [Geochorda subterranea]|uniref:Mutator family transposase n=1 Tax=Geochorda subterranea TaxID=3109564 RepID=A0ABZ1BQZ4_9FIRM|nr:transposase [Limnochorda sp. LNt]WRP15252.1 transposase [Limnochorda sp. LNt]